MQVGGEQEDRETESLSEGGGEWVVFMQQYTDLIALLGWGLLQNYIKVEITIEERQQAGSEGSEQAMLDGWNREQQVNGEQYGNYIT